MRVICTQRVIDEERITLDEEIRFTFRNRVMTEVLLVWTYSFRGDIESLQQSTITTLEGQFSGVSNSRGIRYEIGRTRDGVQALVFFDLSRLTADEVLEFDFITQYRTHSPTEVALSMDRQRYICG